MGSKLPVYVVLDNIRSVHNVASIFRTAECFGVSEIILVGYTPAPTDRFGRARKDFAKVSLGAEKILPWRQFKGVSETVRFLKKMGAQIIAVEQSPKALDYRKVKAKLPRAYIFGNEVGGVSKIFLQKADAIAEIPMRGAKESLNVSVAAGVVLARMVK